LLVASRSPSWCCISPPSSQSSLHIERAWGSGQELINPKRELRDCHAEFLSLGVSPQWVTYVMLLVSAFSLSYLAAGPCPPLCAYLVWTATANRHPRANRITHSSSLYQSEHPPAELGFLSSFSHPLPNHPLSPQQSTQRPIEEGIAVDFYSSCYFRSSSFLFEVAGSSTSLLSFHSP